jgi:DNA-binding XRE family transcriptional regulator
MSTENHTVVPLPHPLIQLRKILGWSRVDCAEASGLTPSSVQNIERGSAPLAPETAFALEGATGCNAMHLAEAAETWRRLKGKQPAVMQQGLQEPAGRDYAEYFHPKTLLFEPFTRDYYERYVQSPLPSESAQNAVLDLGRRIGLLLGTLAAEPQRFRRTYRQLAHLINGQRQQAGVKDPEMAEFAANMGTSEQKEMTLAELGAEEKLPEHPLWQQADLASRFKPEDKFKVTVEKYPFWPGVERLGGDADYFVPDFTLAERKVWRITLPDGSLLTIPVVNTRSTGLRGKLTPAMTRHIRLQRELGKKDSTAD